MPRLRCSVPRSRRLLKFFMCAMEGAVGYGAVDRPKPGNVPRTR